MGLAEGKRVVEMVRELLRRCRPTLQAAYGSQFTGVQPPTSSSPTR